MTTRSGCSGRATRRPSCDPTILDRATYPTQLGDALNILAGAALTYRKLYNAAESVWALIGLLAVGRLLAPAPAPAIT